jgi:hypothetical protein
VEQYTKALEEFLQRLLYAKRRIASVEDSCHEIRADLTRLELELKAIYESMKSGITR